MIDASDAIVKIIDGIESAKPLLRLIPPPAGPVLMYGVEIAEALATFVNSERHAKVTEQIIALLRAGAGEAIEASFAQTFPNG